MDLCMSQFWDMPRGNNIEDMPYMYLEGFTYDLLCMGHLKNNYDLSCVLLRSDAHYSDAIIIKN
jgi:hypothetical protein